MAKVYFTISVISGFLAVAIGAFGAHGLREVLDEYGKSIFETGNKYHFYHTLALLIACFVFLLQEKQILQCRIYFLNLSCLFFSLGLLIFPLTLYALAITGIKFLGAITPIGGVSFLFGWIFLGLSLRFSEDRKS